ncbi:MAG: rhodanese-related sulfurtransferase [Candidatus Pacebacteria bacterium]|nr:rhodanese-related sulfurtransferase [Candidatus Paceibacterota bacterium]
MISDFVVILFYKFVDLDNPKAVVDAHKKKATELGLNGRMLVAEEGINGTFEGTREAVDGYKKFLKEDPRFADMPIKESAGTGKAFGKLKIKVRPEVVTLGAGRFNVKEETAPELSVSELKKWYENNEDFVVLDLRNDFEIDSGKFDRTLDPKLEHFRDLPKKLKELKDSPEMAGKKIVTVCTGGIRCEKATCLMTREGFTDVYQLKDGIHTYMKEYPGQDFKGTLFVFDDRMTTDVVPLEKKEVIGKCTFCGDTTENYCSDDSVRPSRKLLCCEECYEKEKSHLRQSVTLV